MKKTVAILCTVFLITVLFAGCGETSYEREKRKLDELQSQYDAIVREEDAILNGNSKSSSSSKAFSTSATMGEQNALKSAKNYLSTSLGFSKKGLEEQLDYEGFSESEISYAITNCGADWKQQAVKSAKNYLNTSLGFSRSSLIDQLEYEGFTYEQAVYGVEQNGY